MKKLLLEYINNIDIKHLSKAIKKNSTLFAEINQAFGRTISEKIYNYLYPDRHICPNNKIKKYKSFNEGYAIGCGKASVCECVRNSVSKKVSSEKQAYSTEKKQDINKKRSNTTFEKHGVTNNGQTLYALQQHQEFYQDKEKVKEVNNRISNTKRENHGDPNYKGPR